MTRGPAGSGWRAFQRVHLKAAWDRDTWIFWNAYNIEQIKASGTHPVVQDALNTYNTGAQLSPLSLLVLNSVQAHAAHMTYFVCYLMFGSLCSGAQTSFEAC